MTAIDRDPSAAGGDDDPARDLLAALPEGSGTLLTGAFDVHVHGQPDLSPALENRGDDRAVMRLARAYGMSGWVLKSHLWITTDRAARLQEEAGEGFTVYGSVTLNPPMGGVSAAVVELAAAHGARVVFLPTWGSAADVDRGGYISRLLGQIAPSFPGYAAKNAVSLLAPSAAPSAAPSGAPSGRLSGECREVIDACRGLGLALATGHASLAESRAVAAYCADIGQRLLITHPLHYTQDPAELRELADLGAYVEFCNGPLLHPDSHLTVHQVHEAMSALGPDRIVLSTDAFSRWAPAEPECLRIFTEQLAYLGWQPGQLHQMTADNPRAFLGIAPTEAAS
ncbi:MAG TPA: DUF6282 family protein [Trebonia sp.]|nr:DUF6282 family protein [Trebonia sp.]